MAKKRFHDNEGPSHRQLRVGELIRRTLSDALNQGMIHDPDLNRMSITISEVRISPDLQIATAFIMPLGGKNPEEAVKAMARNKGELRRILGKAMTLKHTPDLRFLIDETFDRMDATRRLFEDENVRRDLDSNEDE